MTRLFFFPLVLAAFAGPVLASGTVSQPSIPRATPAQDSHERGRAEYTRKLACSDCPVPGGATDAATAKQLVMRIDGGEFELSRGERRRIKAFLNQRFAL
ncbi:hypothetical protein [Silanimonas sp.]|uniref:hypothetical protein n=1 Tax=Silanimonas sp. TaxID=1929290 RepID=UPI0022BDAE67|nr:hypothetical protein [Silanimonas sp.]MCZ8165658.1 hypothetical protein [Silanimonas sp.]